MTPADKEWLAKAKNMVDGNDHDMPEQGKYNGGQKVMFWALAACMLLMTLSGLAIWRAWFGFDITLVRLGAVVHAAAAAVMIGLIMVHVYARDLGQGHGARHVVRHGHPRLGQAAPSRLVPSGHRQVKLYLAFWGAHGGDAVPPVFLRKDSSMADFLIRPDLPADDAVLPPTAALHNVIRVCRGIAAASDDEVIEEVPVAARLQRHLASRDAGPRRPDLRISPSVSVSAKAFWRIGASCTTSKCTTPATASASKWTSRRNASCNSRNAGATWPGAPVAACAASKAWPTSRACRPRSQQRASNKSASPPFDRCLQQLNDWQPLRRQTGSAHGAAWADLAGNIQCCREDVGRHNALDKLVGALARQKTPRGAGFALVTSRASYEMVQKAATAGITTLVAIPRRPHSPSARPKPPVSCCSASPRPGQLVAYSHSERLGTQAENLLHPVI